MYSFREGNIGFAAGQPRLTAAIVDWPPVQIIDGQRRAKASRLPLGADNQSACHHDLRWWRVPIRTIQSGASRWDAGASCRSQRTAAVDDRWPRKYS